MTRQPTPREAARPFDYAEPTPDEMRAAIGGRNWVVARRTPRIVERYGSDVICLSQAKYASAEARAIEARGWARPVELLLRDVIKPLDLYPELLGRAGEEHNLIAEIEALLAKARNPWAG